MKKIRFFGYRTLKTAIGAALSVGIAMELGLQYPTAAGIITILTVQSTKKQSFESARQRMGGCLLALGISSVLFQLFGFSNLIFGVFLLFFIPLSAKLNFAEGIAVNSVLVTHLLIEKTITVSLIANEISLMIIGLAVAVLSNLYMPSMEHVIRKEQAMIEGHMREILIYMANALRKNKSSIIDDELFNNLEKSLQFGREKAYKNLENSFFHDNSYYVKYMEMRIKQYETLVSMRSHFSKFCSTYTQTLIIADYTQKVANSVRERNSVESLLENFKELKGEISIMELPKTREEFENRAMLYQYLNDLERFLLTKQKFKKEVNKN